MTGWMRRLVWTMLDCSREQSSVSFFALFSNTGIRWLLFVGDCYCKSCGVAGLNCSFFAFLAFVVDIG